ncbi:glycosyltransferase [Mucilaginibacter achroorhodeus]|uniref:Glycosyltransferase n=1 Tax=Mucilaginibacter achroorhodeus TaxID=2599294 RepID=A0A563UA56_9SPHI|nr:MULTISPECIES: glycosyltransferase [Mucilaginibacter]QXV66693.1 glycosyltransferase [Mucilaginibacter sp. 21P]TWR28196.1 glycosyltransferase [Mucilaginibacter achroorhodeus]
MSSNNRQIFQADNPGRWNRFKWLSRVLLIVFVVGVVAAVITVTSKEYPALPVLDPTPKRIAKEDLNAFKKSKRYRDFTIEKAEIEQLARARRLHQLKHPNNARRINAAFYKAWESQAYTSLVESMPHLDMIISEGFSFSRNADTLTTAIDTGLINVNKRFKKQVLVTLSNYVNIDNKTGEFDTKDVQRIFKSKKLRTAFINSMVGVLKHYNFNGVNVEIEDIKNRNSKEYIAFQNDLYRIFKANDLLVTQNVAPDDEEYDLKRLQHVNDYLFVMAIDEHNDGTNSGDVAHQHWVEEILDHVCSLIPSEKVILTLASGGYDWPEGSVGQSIGYQQAIGTAQQKNKKIIFDSNSANSHYTYLGNDGLDHTVYFADAATNFNVMRMADDWATGGVALWRLGGEDPRLWTFFRKNLSIDSLKKTGVEIKRLTTVGLNNNISYAGDGEVLDLITVPNKGEIDISMDPKNFIITSQYYKTIPTKYVIRKYGYKPGKIVLTFDDGPDPDYTPRILDILKREKVPGSFFVVGSMVEKNIPLLKRIYDEGYEIGNHTFFHPDISTISLERVNLELNSTRKLIESVTGHSTILFRPPFNADAEPQTLAEVIPVAESRRQSYITIGESIDPWDWQPGVTADSIIARTIRQKDNGSMILLHDAGGDTREETVKALPAIIHFFKKNGYEFTTIADILNKKKIELMPVATDEQNFWGHYYDIVVVGFFLGNKFFFYVFLFAIFLAMGRIILIGILATRQFNDNKKIQYTAHELPPISIIVPAYNEEVTATKTIESLLKTEYPVFNIIFVDDGSKDSTYKVVSEAYANHPKVTVLTKPNGGKASALNFGISHATNDYVICIDADTQLKNDAIYHMMTYFTDEQIGAVAGTVKVGNETNMITKWQSLEYITAQNMDRRAFDIINSITVVPGAIGAFRKSAIFRAGGFTYDTLAEDCDLTMRILKEGYVVKNCAEAIAYTEAPETLNALLKQRFRWSFGVIQSFWKNRDALFNSKFNYFGMVGMPNILIFQIILPLFSPLADLIMILGLFGSHPEKMLVFYVAFLLVDFIVGAIAFRMEKEPYGKLVYLIPQRFIWRQLMYYILFKSIRKALKGELNTWGVLKRTGNVKVKKAGLVGGGDEPPV